MYLDLVQLDFISSNTHHDTFAKSVSREDNFMKGDTSGFVMSFRVHRSLLLAMEFINGANIFSFTSKKSFVIDRISHKAFHKLKFYISAVCWQAS